MSDHFPNFLEALSDEQRYLIADEITYVGNGLITTALWYELRNKDIPVALSRNEAQADPISTLTRVFKIIEIGIVGNFFDEKRLDLIKRFLALFEENDLFKVLMGDEEIAAEVEKLKPQLQTAEGISRLKESIFKYLQRLLSRVSGNITISADAKLETVLFDTKKVLRSGYENNTRHIEPSGGMPKNITLDEFRKLKDLIDTLRSTDATNVSLFGYSSFLEGLIAGYEDTLPEPTES